MRIEYLLKSSKVVWSAARIELICILLINIFQGILPLFTLIITQKLLNTIQQLFTSNDKVISNVIIYLILQLLINLTSTILDKYKITINIKLEQKIDYKIKKIVANKVLKVKYQYFEDNKFYDHLQRVQGDIGNKFLDPILKIIEITRNSITLVSTLIFLIQFHWLFLFLSIISAIPLFIMQKKFGEQNYFLMKFQTPKAREQNYIFSLLVNRQANRELRLNQTYEFLIQKWSKSLKANNNDILMQVNRQQNKLILFNSINHIISMGTVILLLFFIFRKSIKIGDFVSINSAVQIAQISINTIATMLADIYKQNLFITDLYELLGYEDEQEISVTNELQLFPKALQKGIQVKNLSFSYPGTEKKVIKNINFDILPNEKLVIVGENGSGKSTLIKCLIGSFEVPNNTIFFDEIDKNRIEKKSLYSNIAVIFQDFVKYELTAKENISIGSCEFSEDTIISSSKIAESHSLISELPNSYNTQLGRLFGNSTDLSGGQWQRIAIARALIKTAPILILDEPTSALDPNTEAHLFEKFKEISNGKITIFISHRMYACHLADRIIVMKDGGIVEMGTHNELLNLHGEYFNLYSSQKEKYIDPKEDTVKEQIYEPNY
ncbi:MULTISPECIES: ABC transporter ATP-binding protein [Bacillus cereus group]|nr:MULTISPECIES: ABC transporter ATP-binding protein [Bacillus cereus group]MDX5837652.1 ABC transporter ATP-binding protein [Bacillus cereus group sp. BfR-BA-01700]MED4386526.1 ABC transporter ATP-binding protein [Bacillus mobilis]